MIIKKYVGDSLNEVMTRVKFELGKDAIIISQRKMKKPGFFGFFSHKLVEITATIENKVKDSNNINEKEVLSEAVSQEDEFKQSIESIKMILEKEENKKKSTEPSLMERRIIEHNKKFDKNEDNDKHEKNAEIKEQKLKIQENNSNAVEDVKKEVNELKCLINKVIENTSKDNDREENAIDIDKNSLVKKKLKDYDIDECFFEEILGEINYDEENVDESLRNIFERDVLVSSKELTGKVVLVGPTGVGKTTTIAKLAGRLALIEKKKIGLITVDTYRIGAIEQLKTYAEIMDIEFSVVITTKEMENAIESMKDCDVILIDTTGRSSKNAMQISELRAFVQKADPNIISMVLSATTKNKDIKTILNGYGELNFNNVIVTKLDETTSYGCLYNIAKISNKPINFITVGQNVPDDIRIPTKEKIAAFILGEEMIC